MRSSNENAAGNGRNREGVDKVDKVFEAYLELNKQMLMQNMSGEFEIHLSDVDFERLFIHMSTKYAGHICYDMDSDTLRKLPYYKIAGPGGYITFKRIGVP